MQGPFYPGTGEQGYQLNLIPKQLYQSGIEAVNNYIKKQYSTNRFADLESFTQLEVIHAMEAGELDKDGIPVKAFFHELHKNVLEGYFSDPIYGGNRDMVGWKLLGFPGVDAYYLEDVEREGMQYERQPTGLNRSNSRLPR